MHHTLILAFEMGSGVNKIFSIQIFSCKMALCQYAHIQHMQPVSLYACALCLPWDDLEYFSICSPLSICSSSSRRNQITSTPRFGSQRSEWVWGGGALDYWTQQQGHKPSPCTTVSAGYHMHCAAHIPDCFALMMRLSMSHEAKWGWHLLFPLNSDKLWMLMYGGLFIRGSTLTLPGVGDYSHRYEVNKT